MAAVVRTRDQLTALFHDNVLGDISAQDGRDLVTSAFGFASPVDPTNEWDAFDSAGVGAFFDIGSQVFQTTTQILWCCYRGTRHTAIWQPASNGSPTPPPATIVDALLPVVSTPSAPNTYTISLQSFPPAPASPAPGMLTWLKRNGPFWQDLGKTTPALTLNAPVMVADDGSPNGFDYIAVYGPFTYATLVPRAQAGFAAVQSYFGHPPDTSALRSHTAIVETVPFTVFFAFKMNAISGNQPVILFNGGTLPAEFLVTGGNFVIYGIWAPVIVAPADTVWHTMAIEFKGATSTYSLDGAAPVVWNQSPAYGGLERVDVFRGAYHADTGDAQVGEFIGYDRTLSAGEYAQNAGYMSAWLGSPVGLGVTSLTVDAPIEDIGTSQNPHLRLSSVPGAVRGAVNAIVDPLATLSGLYEWSPGFFSPAGTVLWTYEIGSPHTEGPWVTDAGAWTRPSWWASGTVFSEPVLVWVEQGDHGSIGGVGSLLMVSPMTDFTGTTAWTVDTDAPPFKDFPVPGTSVALPSDTFIGPTGLPLGGVGNVTLQSQTANKVWAGPASGAPFPPNWRLLVLADLPSIDFTDITGTVDVSQLPTLDDIASYSGPLAASNVGSGYLYSDLSGAPPAVTAFQGAGTTNFGTGFTTIFDETGTYGFAGFFNAFNNGPFTARFQLSWTDFRGNSQSTLIDVGVNNWLSDPSARDMGASFAPGSGNSNPPSSIKLEVKSLGAGTTSVRFVYYGIPFN